MDNDELKTELAVKLEGLADAIAKLSNEILKIDNAFGASVDVHITNLMGNCKIAIQIQTSGKDSLPHVNEMIDGAVADFKAALGIPQPGAEKVEGWLPGEKVDVEAALKDILGKRTPTEKPAEPKPAEQPADQLPPDAPPPAASPDEQK